MYRGWINKTLTIPTCSDNNSAVRVVQKIEIAAGCSGESTRKPAVILSIHQ
jgi:hypothetical protein